MEKLTSCQMKIVYVVRALWRNACWLKKCQALTGHLCSSLSQPLRINGVKVYSENVDKRQIIMDLQIRWHHIIYAMLTSFDLFFNFLVVPQVLIFLFSFIAMLEILKSMWMSKGTTVEQGSKVYRYIVIYSHKTF